MTTQTTFLNKHDTFSFLLTSIYAASADDDYLLLTDLMNMLGEKKFKDFIALFEGQTIRIPSVSELTEMIKAMLIYAYHDVDKLSMLEVQKRLGIPSEKRYSAWSGTSEYKKLKKLIAEKKINLGGVADGFPPESAKIIQ